MAPLLPLPPAVQAHRCPPRAQGITGAHHQRGERGGGALPPPPGTFAGRARRGVNLWAGSGRPSPTSTRPTAYDCPSAARDAAAEGEPAAGTHPVGGGRLDGWGASRIFLGRSVGFIPFRRAEPRGVLIAMIGGAGGGSGGEAPCRATAPARGLASVTQARRFVSGLGRGSRRLGGPEGPLGRAGRAGQPGGRGVVSS